MNQPIHIQPVSYANQLNQIAPAIRVNPAGQVGSTDTSPWVYVVGVAVAVGVYWYFSGSSQTSDTSQVPSTDLRLDPYLRRRIKDAKIASLLRHNSVMIEFMDGVSQIYTFHKGKRLRSFSPSRAGDANDYLATKGSKIYLVEDGADTAGFKVRVYPVTGRKNMFSSVPRGEEIYSDPPTIWD